MGKTELIKIMKTLGQILVLLYEGLWNMKPKGGEQVDPSPENS